MYWRPLILLLLTALVLATGIPRVTAAPPDPFAGDGRLSQRITLEARRRPVPEVLESISRQTGVSLRAEQPASDLRVHAFLDQTSADTTLRRLAELLHLTWRRVEGKEPPAYTLVETQVDVEATQAVRRGLARAVRDHLQRLFMAATQPEKLGNSLPEQAAKSSARSGMVAGMVRLLHMLGEGAQDQLVQQGRLVFSGASLPPAVTRATSEFRLGQLTKNSLPVERQGAEAPLVLLTFTLEQRPHLMLDAQFRTATGGIGYSFPLFGSLPNMDQDEMRHFGERLVTTPPTAPIQLPSPSARLDDALAQFVQQNHVSLIADALDADYPEVVNVTPWAPSDKTPPAQVLDRLCWPYDYTWNAQDRLLLFRRRDWAVARDQQISVTAEREWQQAAREGGAYTLAQLAEMAVMNREQRKKLIRYAGAEAARMVNGKSTHTFLLLLAALTPAQRAQLLREGLRSDRFNPQQAHLLEAIVETGRPGPLDLPHSFQQLEIRDDPGTRVSTAILRFRDGEMRSFTIDRTAKPLPDPGASRAWSLVPD